MRYFLMLQLFLCLFVTKTYSQDSLLVKNLQQNKYHFDYRETEGFTGNGWDSIVSASNNSQYTVIGEIHGTNEIPLFLQGLEEEIGFETFVVEIDPYLKTIIENKTNQLTEKELQDWQRSSAGNLSFYSYKNDFELLKSFRERKNEIVGIDQITAINDIPVYFYLAEITDDEKKKELYLEMAIKARDRFDRLTKDPAVRPYLMSPQFEADLDTLRLRDLSEEEKEILAMLEYSKRIYTSRDSHQMRIKLMKKQLMTQYDKALKNKKALIRLGANHSAKGESLQFPIFDVGNLIHNLAESQFNTSYHLAIFSKTGEAGHPLIGNAHTEVNLPQALDFIKSLATDDKWTYFDLRSLKRQLESDKVEIKSDFLRRLIKGFDGLVIIPKASAGVHFE